MKDYGWFDVPLCPLVSTKLDLAGFCYPTDMSICSTLSVLLSSWSIYAKDVTLSSWSIYAKDVTLGNLGSVQTGLRGQDSVIKCP